MDEKDVVTDDELTLIERGGPDGMEGDLERLCYTVRALREVVERVEWAGFDLQETMSRCCPECGGLWRFGVNPKHEADCALAAVLGR